MTLFLLGLSAPIILFVYSLLRREGIRGGVLFLRIVGRGFVKAFAMLAYFFVPMILLSVGGYFISGGNISEDISFGASLILVLVVVIGIPLSLIFIAWEARIFNMYLLSDVREYSLAIILSIGTVGVWWGVINSITETEIIFYLLLVAIICTYALASVCGLTSWRLQQSSRVNGAERVSLIVMLCISFYLLEKQTEQNSAAFFTLGYICGAILIRFLQIWWVGPGTGTNVVPKVNLASEPNFVPLRIVAGITILSLLISTQLNFTASLISALLIFADLSTTRSNYGYASVWIDWKTHAKTHIPSLLKSLTIKRL